MKINKKIIISTASILALVSNLLMPFGARAWGFGIPGFFDVSGAANDAMSQVMTRQNEIFQSVEQRYGFDENILKNAKRKESAPRVEMFFDNTNPKPGEKVTAHAIPEYFKNDPQNLYYTWYIIHTTDGNIKNATNSIKDGKIEAAKLMARGDYDPNLDGQSYADPGKDPDNDGWPTVDANSYDENKVAAPMGGADGVGGLAEGNDNIEPYKDASAYCDARGAHSTAEQCNLYNTPSSFNQYYNFKPDQNGDYCQSCQQSLSFTATLSPDNQCCYLVANPSDPGLISYDPGTSYCPTSYSAAYEGCFDYAGLKNTNKSLIESCLGTAYQACLTNWNNLHVNPTGDEPVSQVSRCYKHNFGTNNPDQGFRGYTSSGNFSEDDSGTDVTVDCKHKWRDAPGYTSGSGKFPTGEEKYWKTDPTDPDTDGDGFPDEADAVGLGQQDLTWNYQTGDRVGVVVEGTSLIPIDEQSAYFKIMWGYSDVCDSTKVGLMDNDECDSSDDYGYGFLATRAPNEQGDDKLKVSLSFSPDNPLADPSDANKDNILGDGTITNADQISVSSSLDNTDFNPSELYYTWQIQKGDPQKDEWGGPLDISNNFSTASPSAGMGISQFDFKPKKDILSGGGDIIYFKVTLTVGKASDLATGRGRSSVIIPVNKNGIQITLHKVAIVDGKATVGDEICNDGLYKTLCPAVKGQMLAAQVSGNNYKNSDSQFSWTVDGNSYYPPENAPQLFDGWNNTTIFFPVNKEEQEIENISVTATSKDVLQPATGTRQVTVVHPAVFIKSADTNVSWPKVYSAPSPNQKSVTQNIESGDAFEALAGSTVPYNLDFVPYYLLGNDSNTEINWSVNGTNIFSPDFYANNPTLDLVAVDNNNRTVKMPIGETAGVFTTLSAEVKKYWGDDERSISYSAWGIAPDTLSGNSSVSIETVNADSTVVVGTIGGPGQILAAMGTHLPHYFMYLLRLVLTMLMMFVVSAGFYGLTQKLSLSDEEE